MGSEGTNRNRLPKSQARKEFILTKDKIASYISQGFDFKSIHALLSDSHEITMSYSTFCGYVRQALPKKQTILFKSNQALKPDNHSGSKGFSISNTPNINDLVHGKGKSDK